MNIIEHLRQQATSKQATIVLPRSSDERVIQAANYLTEHELCKVIVLSSDKLEDLSEKVQVLNPETDENLHTYAEYYYGRRKHKGISREEAQSIVKDPLFFAASMVAQGDADGCVAGSVSTTGDVLRAAIQVIGLKPGSDVVSSIFLMTFADGRVYSYGDCAVVPYPEAGQLATIAVDSSHTHNALTGQEPSTAMLSFSTKGSARHERVQLVQDALAQAKEKNPLLNIDGELQFDAAVIEQIGKRKAPGSDVAGQANVFIFPNLDAGNIAYKITERLAGATATGPIIQGLNKPMMDLSRGCSWEDIVNTSCVAALMS